jgi:hypothetical protein
MIRKENMGSGAGAEADEDRRRSILLATSPPYAEPRRVELRVTSRISLFRKHNSQRFSGNLHYVLR